MAEVAITQGLKRMTFPGLGIREAIEAFTEAAYGQRLSFGQG